MKAPDDSAVGVELPLFASDALVDFATALAPFQLRAASRATLLHTPSGGRPLLPIWNGVTRGSDRYMLYVAHRCAPIALVQGAFLDVLFMPLCDWGPSCCGSIKWKPKPFSGAAIPGLNCKSSSEKQEDSWLKEDLLVRVDREVEGRDSGSGLDSQSLIQSMFQFGYLEGVREGGSSGAGVLGGVASLLRPNGM